MSKSEFQAIGRNSIAFARSMSLLEILFSLVTIVVGTGMIVGGPEFAKIGIPLTPPASMGGIPKQKIALFVFEIYILMLLGMAALEYWRKPMSFFPNFRDRTLWYFCFTILTVGMIQVLLDFRSNPIQAIRNSCFIWYLIVPLLISRLSLRTELLEALMWVFSLVIFLLLTADVVEKIYPYFAGNSLNINWYSTSGGAYGVLALAFLYRNWKVYLPIFLIFAIALAIDASGPLSRTNLVAIAATYAILLVIRVRKISNIFLLVRRLAIFMAILGVTLLAYKYSRPTKQEVAADTPPPGQSVVKSVFYRQSTGETADDYRREMWKDAWGLFMENLAWGIGFQRQVVYRKFHGPDFYVPNLENGQTGQPPISGPHNSYLNALTRMGVFGITFFALHTMAALLLLNHGLLASFFLFLGQTLYAFFNVGLEGPARSCFILFILGLVLRLDSPGLKKLWQTMKTSPQSIFTRKT